MTPGRVCAASLAALGFTSWDPGVVIGKGEAIFAAHAAAGRRPGKYGEDADRFDVARPGKEYLALVHGVHFCLGAPLGRQEARALQALLDSGSRPGAFACLNSARPGR
ncbi:hypothetical protein [Streptomyces chartreusis]|uniref:hypothetical protein n=1 Tax=Streptomyces chartreusis TaxID=1969 RepID=UPI0036335A7C